jgi:hypothetical protein
MKKDETYTERKKDQKLPHIHFCSSPYEKIAQGSII